MASENISDKTYIHWPLTHLICPALVRVESDCKVAGLEVTSAAEMAGSAALSRAYRSCALIHRSQLGDSATSSRESRDPG